MTRHSRSLTTTSRPRCAPPTSPARNRLAECPGQVSRALGLRVGQATLLGASPDLDEDADPSPPAEASEFSTWMGKLQDPAARFAQFILYALLFAAPAVGILLQFSRGDALPIFGIVEIASPWLEDRAFARSVTEVHEALAHALVFAAAMHAAAALIHPHLAALFHSHHFGGAPNTWRIMSACPDAQPIDLSQVDACQRCQKS